MMIIYGSNSGVRKFLMKYDVYLYGKLWQHFERWEWEKAKFYESEYEHDKGWLLEGEGLQLPQWFI
jgi:hypothetical protein